MTVTAAVSDQRAMRTAQAEWSAAGVRRRLACIAGARRELARRPRELAEAVQRPAVETLTAEVIPLLEALRFLEGEAERILAPEHLGSDGQPMWLRSVELELRRDPFGVILVVGPANYPLLLPAVHAAQALTAGNAVIVKPGRGGHAALAIFIDALRRAGIPHGLIRLLGEDPEEAKAAIRDGVDKVAFTGSGDAGLDVLAQLAPRGVPSVMELSGHDAVFVRPGADLDLVVRALRFGVTLNKGETCIAPKQVFAAPPTAEALRLRLQTAGIALPVVPVSSDEAALRLAAESGYALGATVFGPEEEAVEFARRVHAGCVVVNDMIAPTADPRMPFGGRGRSGFGVTRGAAGLLEMTTIKAIVVRRSGWLPHLDESNRQSARMFEAYIRWSHGTGISARLGALGILVREAVQNRSRKK